MVCDVPLVLPDDYQSRYDRRMEFLKAFDTGRQVDPAWAPKRLLEWESFTRGAHKMLKSPEIGKIFQLTEEEAQTVRVERVRRCVVLVARNMVKAQAGRPLHPAEPGRLGPPWLHIRLGSG